MVSALVTADLLLHPSLECLTGAGEPSVKGLGVCLPVNCQSDARFNLLLRLCF